VGAGINHLTVRDGRRMSAWQSFVAPVRNSPLLTVTTGARAHRILFEGRRAVGVEFLVADEVQRTYAAAEVIICGGVIGSPQLLMLSGIGPAGHLREVGVDVLQEIPGVGLNLHDHPVALNVYETVGPLPAGKFNLTEAQLFAKTDTQRLGPDLQPLMGHIPYPAEGYPVPEHGYTIAPAVVRPLSRGTVRLASADPERPPLVDPRVLAEPQDLEALVDATEICREIGSSAAFKEWRKVEVAPGPEARSRDDLREFVRRTVATYHHQVGTCRMGQDSLSVVDPQLRVHGVGSLRIADASIMPAVPSGNTNAAAIMIGEKAADLILSTTGSD
jgi:choline dehydrogenase